MNLKTFTKSLILLLCIFIHSSFADLTSKQNNANQLYQIDVIVFKYNNLSNLDPSIWQNYQSININNSLDLQQPMQNNETFQVQPIELSILKKEAYRISHSNSFTLLSHQTWIQSMTQTQPVRITGGQQYVDLNKVQELDGTISFSKSAYSYFTMQANLELTELDPSQTLKSILLAEKRRIIPNQLNYLDTPGWGLLVMIKPVNQSLLDSQTQNS